MEKNIQLAKAREIMLEFAELTGLSGSGKPPKRYLWTDAFAVCNFLELSRQTGEEEFRDLALRLVDQVHHILGRHRPDDFRKGWISGLGEAEGARHPTLGGLRIGKPFPERRSNEPYDEQLEWDRDGQYYHYLTKWMQALDQVSRVTGDFTFNRFALELARTVHHRFVTLSPEGDRKRMYWKMRIDLSTPLVPFMGQHDPLDGLITYTQLRDTWEKDPGKNPDLDLKPELAEMAALCRAQNWFTDDPLGLGGLLSDAYRSLQLLGFSQPLPPDLPWLLLSAARAGLDSLSRGQPFDHPADFRLAFRELGLSIGLQAVERLEELMAGRAGGSDWLKPPAEKAGAPPNLLEEIRAHFPFRERIQSFWLDRRNRAVRSWTDHREINMVMLATSLAPDGYLTLT